MPAERGDLTDDAILGGRLRLLQPRRGHRFGHDAVLLAAAVAARPGERAIDLGAGVGAAGLALAARVAGLSVMLADIDEGLARLAAENAARNGLADRVRALELDVTGPLRALAAAGLSPGSFDHVLMNPPFHDPARHKASPDAARRAAHVGGAALARWVKAAAWLLRPAGTLTFIQRADAMAQALSALESGFGDIAILPVHPKPKAPAIRLLLAATKGSRAPLRLLPGLVLNDASGQTTPEAEAVLREGESFRLTPG